MGVQARRSHEADDEFAPFGFDGDGWLGLMRDAAMPADLGAVAGFRVIDEVGRGGQGLVFRAYEAATGRTVALKRLVGGSLAGAEARARFEREIVMEAALRHPHIVGVRGVELIEGQPLLVMEWIDGVPADRWARPVQGPPRPVRDVLGTFVLICDAVAYAHQRGVIHRDLKPSNILIDAGGAPHVLDFGMARWRPGSGQWGPEPSRLTRTEGFVGTPAYAAPEQLFFPGVVEGLTRDGAGNAGPDVRSDVYALGVVLYEMLAGVRPFGAQQNLEQMLRAIREEDPVPPSRHDRRIGDEVDAITLRAMAKDPSRRYQSVYELGADVRRHLAGDAVEARRDSAWYVFRKLLHRHRMVAAAGVAVGAALIFGLGATALGLVAARRSAAGAAAQAEVAKAVNDFLNLDVLRAIVPAGESAPGRGRDVSLREVLDEAAKRLEEASAPGGRLADKPLVEAGVRSALGDAYLHLGEPDAAEPHVLRRRDLLAQVYGPADPRCLESAPSVAWLLTDQGRFEESAAYLRPVLDRLEAMPEPEAELAARVRHSLAIAYWRQGRRADATPLYERAIEHYTRTRGPDDPDTLGSLNGLAEVYREQRRYVEAELLYQRLVEASARTLGEAHPDSIKYAGNLASLLWDLERYGEAEPLMRSVLERAHRVHGPDHATTARAMGNLANLLSTTGDASGAEALRREALEAYARSLGAEHPHTLNAATDLAGSLTSQGRPADAEELLRPTLEVQRRTLGAEHFDTRKTMRHLSGVYRMLGRLEEAEALALQVLELGIRIEGSEDARTLGDQTNLAMIYGGMGRLEEARDLLTRTLSVKRRVLGVDHPFTRTCIRMLAQALNELGRSDEAQPLLDELAAWEAARQAPP